MKYDFNKIEKFWQKKWKEEGTYEPKLGRGTRDPEKLRNGAGKKQEKPPFYNLMMFPYPSAEGLHVGNMYAFTGSDIYGRMKRMQGKEVFEPIGLDGFGIHSENYALKIGAHPMKQAKISEKRFYEQLERIGNGFAWKEKLETYNPEYYKWTQWIFVQMWKHGLAYRKKQPVNWCPSCKTVLADEQIILRAAKNDSEQSRGVGTRVAKDDPEQMRGIGVCERCETPVEKKNLEQWFFKITKYAEKLLQNIDPPAGGLDWSEKVKIAQRNWIGRSEGAEVQFELQTKEKPNFVLLHGYGGVPDEGFIPWLKKELETRGFRVQAPRLPHSDEKKANEKDDLELMAKLKLDANTVLVGHSLGAVVAMKAVEGLSQPIRKLVLVGGFLKPEFSDKRRKPIEANFTWRFDFDAIKKNVSEIKILQDANDGIVPLSRAQELQQVLGGELVVFPAREEHVCGTEELVVLENVLDMVSVFTTRPDTLFGATYIVLSPEHSFVANSKEQIENWKEIEKYVESAKKKSEEDRIAEGKEKTGVELKGVKAINPATKEEIPIWVADYVLAGYGTGAIMAVPAHDERDFEFAKQYKLPIREVVIPKYGEQKSDATRRDVVHGVTIQDGKMLLVFNKKINEYQFPGGAYEEGEDDLRALSREFTEETGYDHIHVGEFLGAIEQNYRFSYMNINVHSICKAFRVDLKDTHSVGLKNDDAENMEVRWLSIEEAVAVISKGTWSGMEIFILRAAGRVPRFTTDSGTLIDSGEFSGKHSEVAKKEITEFVCGKWKVQYRLRDWLISRQRYWGAPIPMIHCEACAIIGKGEHADMPGWYAVPEKDLPVKLPFVEDFRPRGKGESPLASVKSFYEVKCPGCKKMARRETDVSDTFLDSAWYFLKYPSNKEQGTGNKLPWNQEVTRRWLPVNMYIGGAEHSVLHLLYSRFVTMALHDMKLLHFEEPFTTFRAHGLLIKEGAKMSKSKGNVVNPDDYIKKFGADTLRMYLMFLAPFEQGGDFRDAGILGVERFLKRVWNLAQEITSVKGKDAGGSRNRGVDSMLHKTIKKVTEDIENLHYNTAISALMILLNEFEKEKFSLSLVSFKAFVNLLAPFAPHMTEEIWQSMANSKGPRRRQGYGGQERAKGKFKSIHAEPWPEYDPKFIVEETFTLVIQVNGKVRDTVEGIAVNISENEARALALSREKVLGFVGDEIPKKVIYIPKKIVNIVV